MQAPLSTIVPTDAVWPWPLALGVLGLILGSHIAVVAIRWPDGRSAMAGRSECDRCGRTLHAIDLVPLVSFAWLRGRCRRCGGGIAALHPLSEGAGALIGIAAGLCVPGLPGIAGAVFGWLLLALAAIDARAFWLPDRLVLALALAGLGAGTAGLPPSLAERAIGGVAGFSVLWLVATAYRRARGRVGLGGGDPKLMGAIGLWLGWRALPATLLVACLIGIAAVVAARLGGRKLAATDALPFGTLLAPAAFLLWCLAA